jgi:hypothetical protein
LRFHGNNLLSTASHFGRQDLIYWQQSLNPQDTDLWLYRDSNFDRPASIMNGLKFGPQAGVGRIGIAVAAGIWPSFSAFVAAPPAGQSLHLVGPDPFAPENWAPGPPSLGSFSLPNKPPVIRIDQPSDGAVLTAPATVTIAVTASDEDGSVVLVDLFQFGVPFASLL